MLSIVRQCTLAGLSRSSYYYEPLGMETEENLALMRVIDRLYLKRPFYGTPRITDWLRAWELSNTLEAAFCVEALERALGQGRPDIFNTDQGSQFTAEQFTGCLERAGVKISMDGRGRAMDNVMVERLWRTVKYEDIYLRDYADGAELRSGLGRYFRFYNTERPHQGLQKRTPAEAHFGRERGDVKVWTESRSWLIGQL